MFLEFITQKEVVNDLSFLTIPPLLKSKYYIIVSYLQSSYINLNWVTMSYMHIINYDINASYLTVLIIYRT